MKFTLFTAIIFSIRWMSVVLAGEGSPVPCCRTVSETRIPAVNIVKYVIQNKTLCPVKAVRFHTKKNKVICSDPDSDWAKKVMKIVDGRLTTKPTCYTSTTNVIPTTATTDKTSGTETEISTSTTVTPAVTTVKTSEMETNTSTIVPTTVTTTETSETEISTSTTVTPAVTTVKTSETETSTSTTVTPAVTTIKTSETETSTSTTVTPAVTKIKTSETETSTSTIVPTTVTTTETSTLETEISKTTIQPTSVSTDNQESSLSTVTTFTSSTTKDCCLTVTRNKPAFHEIVDYRVQETPLCSVRAVLFITVENNKICSSPTEDWVQDYIQNLNRRRKTTTDKREFTIIGIKDPFKNTNNYFCLKKEQAKSFCVKQL